MQKITEKDIQEHKQAFNNDVYATKYLLGIFTPGLMVKILRLRDEPLLSTHVGGLMERTVMFESLDEVF